MTQLHGFCAPGLEPVRDAFAENFARYGEQGASLAVIHRGKPVLTLWGGTRDKAGTLPWQRNSVANLYSASKGILALLVLQAVAAEHLDLDSPIAEVWPEFAAGDKHRVSLRDVLSHRSGVVAFNEKIRADAIYDWTHMAQVVARQAPQWDPGSAQGYSPFIYGWVLGELLRRIHGQGVGQCLGELATALNLHARCGLPEDEHHRIADLSANPVDLPALRSGALGEQIKNNPQGLTARAFSNPASLFIGNNQPQWRSAEIPAANIHGNAEDLAKLYGALANGGRAGPRQLLPEALIAEAAREHSSGHDQVLGVPMRWGLGFMLTQPDTEDMRLGRGHGAFGHAGAGGALGFADPEHGIGFGYVPNRLGKNLLLDYRAIRLIDALYQEL